MRKRTDISLSESTGNRLRRLIEKHQHSRFIEQVIADFMSFLSRRSLRGRLRDAGLASAERDLRIVQEWFPLEQEAWRRTAKGEGVWTPEEW